ncbi:hypothetical protein CC117_29040 [Parafrankia colletiae]|uniref:Glycosyltransferase 2-like domain-containing protein n=1 Tax=Parafrankia colletiae TaxID=573497 RepID=A0A1S1QB35_9ACTN|nr:glycosyltransferase family 2 protein [Parafrankia colletiae]MCK9903553.1 glycosyltransferase [Frankia sp. Cpl3]OHV29444.1 hypothetical protein CC117_29040 [Parafrankia colletiae]
MTLTSDTATLDRLVTDLTATPPSLTTVADSHRTRRGVSALLTTYNRCPFDPAADRLRDNPLTWALDTLLAQAGDTLAEIVVVDDGSTDHTGDVLDHYTALPGDVPVRPVRLAGNAGMTVGRNIAVEAASCDWLLFGDDDCLFSPHYAAGAAHTLTRLRDHDPAAGLVMLPFYYRALRPRDIVDQNEIGQLDITTAHFSTRFHAFPAPYLDGPAPRLDTESGLLAPLPVRLVGGTFLADRTLLARAGGFADQTPWRSAYAEALHLSADLTHAGVSMYFTPDPRLSAPHLKFGAAGRFPLYPDDLDTVVPVLDRPFADLVALSSVPRTNTGARVPDRRLLTEMVGSFFAFFVARSPAGGRAWATRMHRELVIEATVHSLTVTRPPNLAERRAAWHDGLTSGGRAASDSAVDVQAVLDDVTRAVDEPRILL